MLASKKLNGLPILKMNEKKRFKKLHLKMLASKKLPEFLRSKMLGLERFKD